MSNAVDLLLIFPEAAGGRYELARAGEAGKGYQEELDGD